MENDANLATRPRRVKKSPSAEPLSPDEQIARLIAIPDRTKEQEGDICFNASHNPQKRKMLYNPPRPLKWKERDALEHPDMQMLGKQRGYHVYQDVGFMRQQMESYTADEAEEIITNPDLFLSTPQNLMIRVLWEILREKIEEYESEPKLYKSVFEKVGSEIYVVEHIVHECIKTAREQVNDAIESARFIEIEGVEYDITKIQPDQTLTYIDALLVVSRYEPPRNAQVPKWRIGLDMFGKPYDNGAGLIPDHERLSGAHKRAEYQERDEDYNDRLREAYRTDPESLNPLEKVLGMMCDIVERKRDGLWRQSQACLFTKEENDAVRAAAEAEGIPFIDVKTCMGRYFYGPEITGISATRNVLHSLYVRDVMRRRGLKSTIAIPK